MQFERVRTVSNVSYLQYKKYTVDIATDVHDITVWTPSTAWKYRPGADTVFT